MVGIARARGCGTCRKRKIACGKEKPSCAQCIKSRRTCPGYRKYPIFIEHKVPDDDYSSTPVIENNAPAPIKTPTTSNREKVEQCESLSLNVRRPGMAIVDSLVSLHSQGLVNFNPALRTQLLDVYLDHHLSKNRLGPMQQRIWLLNLPFLPNMTTALEVSTMALCLAKLGDVHGDKALIHESLKLYHRGLNQLQLALWDPELMFHDHTLAACVALSMYEMSQCPNASKDGYISHTSGCGRLIQLRGPEAHMDGLAHSVFVHFRIQGILYALERRQPSFLSEPAWQNIPWINKPKTVYDEVYDFFLRAPFLLRGGEMLEHMDPVNQLQLASSMISKCWEMDHDLQLLYDRMEKSREGPLFWPELARDKSLDVNDAEDGMLFPVAFHFPNLMVANTVLVCWSVQTMLWDGMSQLYRLMHEVQTKLTSVGGFLGDSDMNTTMMSAYAPGTNLTADIFELPPLEHREFWVPARNVLQGIEYCLMDDTMDQGPKCVAAPLRIVIETFRGYPKFAEEFRWAERAMEKVQSRSLRLLRFYAYK